MKNSELIASLNRLNKQQLISLGVKFPLKKGWRKELLSKLDIRSHANKPVQKEITITIKSTENKKPKKKLKKPIIKGGFYQSWEWKQLRYKVLLKYNRQCMCCGAMPPNVTLVVDHIKPRSKFPELELKEDNLQVLCNSCNMGKSNKSEMDFRFDEDIKLIEENDSYWRHNL